MKIAACLLIFLLISGCSGKNKGAFSGKGKIVYYAGSFGDEPWGIRSSIYAKGVLYRNVFTQGVYLDENSNLSPGLFASWEAHPEAKSFSVNFDDSHIYSDGTPVKVSDVEFLYLKVFLTPEDYPVFPFQKNLKGVEKLKKGEPFKSGMCECIQVKGKKMTFYLKKFDPNFLHDLSHYFFPVAPIQNFSEDLFSFRGLPVGSGPYKIVFYNQKKALAVLRLRKEFARTKSFVNAPKTVYFYNSGKADEIQPDLLYEKPGIKEERKYKKVVGPVPDSIRVINFNFENKFGKDIEFRKVVSLAINRQEIADLAEDRSPAFKLILNESLGIEEKEREFNPVEAKKIVDRLFKKISSPSRKLKALYYGSSETKKPETYELVEKQLAAVGIHVNFIPSDFSDLAKGRNSDIVMTSIGKVLPYHDFLYPFFVYSGSDESFLNVDPENRKLKTLYEDALEAGNLLEKKKIVGSLALAHAKNYIQVPIYKTFPVLFVNKKIAKAKIDNPLGLVEFGKIN